MIARHRHHVKNNRPTKKMAKTQNAHTHTRNRFKNQIFLFQFCGTGKWLFETICVSSSYPELFWLFQSIFRSSLGARFFFVQLLRDISYILFPFRFMFNAIAFVVVSIRFLKQKRINKKWPRQRKTKKTTTTSKRFCENSCCASKHSFLLCIYKNNSFWLWQSKTENAYACAHCGNQVLINGEIPATDRLRNRIDRHALSKTNSFSINTRRFRRLPNKFSTKCILSFFHMNNWESTWDFYIDLVRGAQNNFYLFAKVV